MGNSEPLILISFDLETTGLDPTRAEIIEIGAVRFTIHGEVLDRFEQLAKPREPIPPEIIKTTGITNQMVCHMAPPEVGLDRFIEWVGDYASILVAHNASFDASFLMETMGRFEREVPPWKIVDTLQWSFEMEMPLKDYRLETILEALGQPITPHRALADAEGVARLLLQLIHDSEQPIGEIERRSKTLRETAFEKVRFPRRPLKSGQLSDSEPATSRQLRYLRYLKVREEELKGLSKRAASQLIERYK